MKTHPINFMGGISLLVSLWLSVVAHAADKPPPACNRLRFEPLPGTEQAMVEARLEGSNTSRTEGYVTLTTINAVAGKNWTQVKFENAKLYRWLRLSMPAGSTAKMGKVEVYANDQLLADDSKGMKFTPFVEGKDAVNDSAIGFDLFATATPNRPAFSPAESDLSDPTDVRLSGPRGAAIRYTLDGSTPTADHGENYTKPIHVEKNTTITAITIAPDRPVPSLPVTVTYLLKDQTKPGLFTAHIGNSLTGTCGGFWRYARTTGYAHQQESFLRPGALTRENWAVATGDYKSDKLANAKETQAQKRGTQTWDEYWSKIGKVDLITLQPRDFDLDKEIAAEISFIRKFREKSPDLQPWLYCEWVEMKRARPSDNGNVPSFQMKRTFPALTWEESMSAMLLYVEELQHRLNPQIADGKPAHIIPSALALGWIHNMIDHGRFPGVKPGSFYPLLFNDQVHPASGPIHNSANGAYLVDLTWYSAFYREAPEGRVLPIETTFTPEQARLIERLAWDVVKNYPDCGLYEEGTEPCGKPQFSSDSKIITLKSSTPGAWFRYTLDGTTPTRTRGYVYCGAISVQPGIQVQAVAYKSGMADSEVTQP
ncbi:MAG: hypothetical protein B7Z47_03490 [Chthoniobacter sp. 12-60-6]|nr:MAG: hypothetical protein B7Z47_03490 [Chthoniobacter sp. 12-60-6]